MIFTGEDRRTRRKPCPNTTSYTTDLCWPGLESDPGRRDERPATNRLRPTTQPQLHLMFFTCIFLFRTSKGKMYFYFKNKLDTNVWEHKLYKIHMEHQKEVYGQNANY